MSSMTGIYDGCGGRTLSSVAIDKETADRIEQPVAAEAEHEARLTPVEAIDRMKINVPVRGNRKLRALIDRVNEDKQLKAWWHVSNVNAVTRMEINDHSWVHIQIVANIALKLLRQLTKHHVEPAVVSDYGMTRDDAEVIVTLAALTHCIGMSIHRHGHEDFSLFLAAPKLQQLLEGIYDEPDRTVIVSEVLQSIISHRADGQPLTIEAGLIRVADALDMAKGRSRVPFERGRVSMHSLSAAAIEDVTITDGEEKPIAIEIRMNNSSGIFQIDGLLKAKLRGSGLEPYVEVVAHIDTETERRLVQIYKLEV
jgi:metal-dependent HD superfamily phosphatase/phosphodiesterase